MENSVLLQNILHSDFFYFEGFFHIFYVFVADIVFLINFVLYFKNIKQLLEEFIEGKKKELRLRDYKHRFASEFLYKFVILNSAI